MKRERWRAVPEYEGLYEISDFGRVRSLGRNACMLKLMLDKNGYLRVYLSDYPRRKLAGVHRLVLLAFVGPCPAGMATRHFPDRTRTNNRLSNLSWATHTTNMRDRNVHGTHLKGERHYQAKLTHAMVRRIRAIKRWPIGLLAELAEKYGVTIRTIQHIKRRETWI
jgi:hypothetical protein